MMKNKITVLNEETFSSGYSQQKLESVEIFIQDVLNHLGFENWEMNVLFCDDKFMQEMNLQYRNIDAPTDVLSLNKVIIILTMKKMKFFLLGIF